MNNSKNALFLCAKHDFHLPSSMGIGIAASIILGILAGCGSNGAVQKSDSSSSAPAVPASASISVTPQSTTVRAGATQAFDAAVSGLGNPQIQWAVNGTPGGNVTFGAISAAGVYTAPAIDPGQAVTISAISVANQQISGSASISVTNPAIAALSGVTYSKARASSDAAMLPWIKDLVGLTWDANSRSWTSAQNWTEPPEGIGPHVYYLEQALRPATRMAIARQDIALMEELAAFHMAMLQQRTTSIGAMLQNAPSNAIIYIDGPPNARTFAWYEPGPRIRIRDAQQAASQYLSTAAQLLRAVAQMPPANRTAPLNTFAKEFSGFLASEQLMRLLYGKTAWSYYDNPSIPQPVVQAWKFLAATGYRPQPPYRYQAAMTDMELWMVSDAAEVIAADAAAPELAILDASTRQQLKDAVLSGTALMQARCPHQTAPDGADVLSAFAGDYDDYLDYAYAGYTGADTPTTPNPKDGLGWDIEHAYRLPIIFRSLYETSAATGATFPTRRDVVALTNSYVHLAFDQNWQMPDFNNFLDGWNGWFRVGYWSIPGGYPPHQYCNSMRDPSNCLTAGTVQGWGELAFVNPDLAKLYQRLVDLAYDDSPQATVFKDQHYYYNAHYSANGDLYPHLMVYIVGDSAERIP